MVELTKQDIGWIFQSALFFHEGLNAMEQMQKGILPKYTEVGKKALEFIRKELEEYEKGVSSQITANMEKATKHGKLFE
jgi:hypothetical protein